MKTTIPNIDLDRAIGLTDATFLLRGRGGHPHIATVQRWANPSKGWLAPDGTKVLLRAVKINGEYLTLPEWVEAFEAERVAKCEAAMLPAPKVRSARSRAAAQRRAGAILDKAGIGV